MQTHGNLLFNAGTVSSVMGVTAADRTLVVAPMFHATGIVSQLVGFGAHGAACVFLPRFRPAGMLGALIEHRITFFAGVTAMIQLMLADPGFDPADLTALRVACFGGAPVAEAFLDEAARRLPHVTLMNVWGLTEATSIVTCAAGSQWLKRPWSVGRPVPGVEVAAAVDGRVADAPDAVGELWVRGPVVTAGYWNRPDATADAFRADGWLRTGDVGRADADGYVQVLDRMKDMIIRGGENIYSLEVEGVLARHPAIAEVAVVGVPDPVMGERVRAVAVLGAGQSLALGALREWAGPSSPTTSSRPSWSPSANCPATPGGAGATGCPWAHRPVVDFAHLVHVDERVEPPQLHAGERAPDREPLALEAGRRCRHRRDLPFVLRDVGLGHPRQDENVVHGDRWHGFLLGLVPV